MVLLFALDSVCMLLYATFFCRGPHSSFPNIFSAPAGNFFLNKFSAILMQCNSAHMHISFFRHGKHPVCLENVVAWFISALKNGNNSRRFPSCVTQSSRTAIVLHGSQQWTHMGCQCCWLSLHVPPCTLFLHSAGNVTVTSAISQSLGTFQVFCFKFSVYDSSWLTTGIYLFIFSHFILSLL